MFGQIASGVSLPGVPGKLHPLAKVNIPTVIDVPGLNYTSLSTAMHIQTQERNAKLLFEHPPPFRPVSHRTEQTFVLGGGHNFENNISNFNYVNRALVGE